MADVGKITNGIDKIEIDGERLGLTEEDSFNFDIDDNTSTTEFMVEENDNPIFTTTSGSKIAGFTFTLLDPDETALQTLFDGELEGGDVEVDGISHILRDVPVKITAKQGWNIEFESVDIDTSFNSDVGKNSLFALDVSATHKKGKIIFEDGDN